jgi:hypothetical protein
MQFYFAQEKAKPAARWGRKTTGLAIAQYETAGLPGKRQPGLIIFGGYHHEPTNSSPDNIRMVARLLLP